MEYYEEVTFHPNLVGAIRVNLQRMPIKFKDTALEKESWKEFDNRIGGEGWMSGRNIT